MLGEFKLSSWLQAYEWVKGQSTEEQGFLSGVVWLNEHFQRVQDTRRQFTFRRDSTLSVNDLIQAHLGAANYAFYGMSREWMENVSQQPDATMEQHMSVKSAMTQGGVEVDPEVLNMYRLDSLCGPFWELFKHRDNIDQLFPEDRPHQLDKLTFFENETSMAQLFHNFSRIWQDLLYGEAGFFPHPKGVVIATTSPKPHQLKAVSEYRRNHHNVFSAMQLSRDIRGQRFIAEALLAQDQYLQYRASDGDLSCTSWQSLSDEVKTSAFYHRAAPHYMVDQHLHLLLDSASSDTKDLTMQNVLKVWFHLAVLATQIKEEALTRTAPMQWSELLAFSPSFNLDELIDHLGRCTDLSTDTVTSIIEMLTYDAKSIQADLWSQPLLRLDDRVCFPVSALLTASIGRNFDTWLNRVDPNSKRRGKLFEKDILNVLQECKSNNPILENHLSWTPAIKFRFEPKKLEEIDLTFVFGNLIVIAELRSRRTPITPLDYHNEVFDKNGIESKAVQASRKAQRVRENLQTFCITHYPSLAGRNDLTVLPLVIINGQFHAGAPCNGVPVLDVHLLKHFLKDAECQFYGSVQLNKSHMYSIPLYDCLEEAARVFPDYARCPTLISVYNALTTKVTTKFDVLGKDFPPIFTTAFEITDVNPERYLQVLDRIANGRLRKNF
jgi:hypothetical protein